jgi:hypothetical protein
LEGGGGGVHVGELAQGGDGICQEDLDIDGESSGDDAAHDISDNDGRPWWRWVDCDNAERQQSAPLSIQHKWTIPLAKRPSSEKRAQRRQAFKVQFLAIPKRQLLEEAGGKSKRCVWRATASSPFHV